MGTKIILLACITASLGISQTTPRPPRIVNSGSFLGVAIQEIDSDRARELKLPDGAGVEVTRIAPESPAEKAGIRTGDVVTQYNGQRVEGIEQFSRMVRETPAGRDVKIEIVRNGAPQSLTAKITGRPAINGQLIPGAPVPMPFDFRFPDMPQSRMSWRNTMLGVDLEALDGQLAEFFAVKQGVLIRTVNRDSAADKAGLRAGDVIVRMDDAKVTTPADIAAHLRGSRGGSVSVVIVRDRKEMTVAVSIARPARSTGKLFPAVLPGAASAQA